MKIFRLSLFNLKRNKREAAAIVFLILVTAFLTATFAVSITQISSAFDRCFEETGSAGVMLLFKEDKYRDIYRDILEDEYNVTNARESGVLFGAAASTISAGICIIAAGVAVMFSVYTFDFFKNGHNGLMGVMGMEIPDISMSMMSGVNGEKFCDELRKFPEVEKVLLTRAIGNNVDIKGSNQRSMVISYSDFSLTDNIHPKTGRFPEYDNEIMITAKREETEDRHIGDSIIIKGDFCEKSYIITGIVSAMNNGVLDMASKLRLRSDPGEYACYNNLGFSLLEHIIENVTGMSFTDYVRNNIASKIGADNTGTAWSLYSGELGDTRVSLYRGSLPVEYPYEMTAGSGGIYATASDAANFGGAFFTGNDILLSENAKTQISARWNNDAKYESYGLGWDFVEQVKYEKENIKVMGKGGDVPYMHSCLLVAPDEQISAAVLTAGNGSSQCAALMASALMDVVLEERGKAVSDLDPPEPKITDVIPDNYKKYEGLYCIGGSSGTGICRISFDDTAMYKEALGTDKSSPERYRYTEGGGFVKVNDSGRMTSDREIVYFEEKDGRIYVRTDKFTVYPGLGNTADSMYSGEKMEENPVSPGVQQSWDDLSQTEFVIYNEKWTSQQYEAPFIRVVTDKEFPGYILWKDSAGCTQAEKMNDKDHARFFTTIPSSLNSNLFDIDISGHTYADGTEAVSLDLNNGARCRGVDALPVFTADISEIPLHSNEAVWYRIGEDMSGRGIVTERPDNSAIFVYNKFHELLYSTHIRDAVNTIDLPPDGYIAFIGETGDSVKIFK